MTANPYVFEVTPENFQTEVVDGSADRAVLVLFWADQVPPSAETRRTLEQLLPAYQGKAVLALVDVARDQTLAQHLRVQGLPSIRVVKDGQIIEQVDGPQTENAYRALLDALTLSSAELLKEQLDALLAAEQFEQALALLQQAIAEEPANQAFRVELADVLVLKGDFDDARTVLADIPDDTPERSRPVNRLEFAEEAAGMMPASDLRDQIQQAPDNLEARYQLAIQEAVRGNYEAALDQAMAILQADRSFRDDIGRLTMIRIFDVLGKGSDLATRYRRRMFNFMH